MKMEFVKTVGKSAVKIGAKVGMKLRKASPEIMLVTGLGCGIAAVVTACIATKKAQPVIEEAHEQFDLIEAGVDWKAINDDGSERPLTPKEIKQETFHVYRNYIWKMCKIYGLPAFLLLASVGLILGSHGILKKRYVSTTLAYKALDEAFKDYRKRIQDAVGIEKELHFFNGTEEGGEVTIIDENGDAQTTKQVVKTQEKKYTPYEFDFNAKTAPGNWEANSDYNFTFLRMVENWANDMLKSRGHIFLNEVLDAIGIKRTPEGAIVGWVMGSGGDDEVDFGVYDYYTDEYSDAQDGYLKNIHLNFNVDGVIWNKI